MRRVTMRLWRGLEGLVGRRRLARDIDDELLSHIEYATDELVARGVPRLEARRQARVAFGGVQQTREWVLRERASGWCLDALRDSRLAVRQLRKEPGSSVAIVLVVAIGIACVTTVFSLVNTAWLRPLTFSEPEQLVLLRSDSPEGIRTNAVPMDLIPQLSNRGREVAEFAVFDERRTSVVLNDRVTQFSRTRVDASVLALLRVAPARGRAPTPDEYRTQAAVVLVSDSLWRAVYGAQDSALGSTLVIGGRPHQVIGVMPEGFSFHTRAFLWTPLAMDSAAAQQRRLAQRDDSWPPTGSVVARLRPGMLRDSLAARLQGVTHSGDSTEARGWRVFPAELFDRGRAPVGYSLATIAFLITVIVLIVACANVTNLLLARGNTRRREMAIAAALGASTFRLLRQLLAESLLLALAAGALGIALSALGMHLVLAAVPRQNFPGWLDFSIDWRVLLFAFLISLCTMLLFGLLPAREASRVDPLRAIHDGDNPGVTARSGRSWTARLISVQLALSLMLVMASGMLVAGYRSLLTIRSSYPAERMLETLSLPYDPELRDIADQAAFSAALAQALRTESAVAAVSLHSSVRFLRAAAGGEGPALSSALRFLAPDDTSSIVWRPSGAWPAIRAIDTAYFTMRRRALLRGREFSAGDSAVAPLSLIISEQLARDAWENAPAVGQQVRLGATGPLATIVGVVEDVKAMRFTGGRLAPHTEREIFFAVAQVVPGYAYLTVEARGDVESARDAVRRHSFALDEAMELPGLRTMAEDELRGLQPLRLLASVLSVVAILTLGIAAIGLLGLVRFATLQRQREIGIRLALGATSRQVERLLLGDALRTTRRGLLAGALCAVPVLWLLQSLVPMQPADVVKGTLLTSVALAVIVVVACWIPVRRASRADPNDVLRRI